MQLVNDAIKKSNQYLHSLVFEAIQKEIDCEIISKKFDILNGGVLMYHFVIYRNEAVVIKIISDYLYLIPFRIIENENKGKVFIHLNESNGDYIHELDEFDFKWQDMSKRVKDLMTKGYFHLKHENLDQMGLFELKRFSNF